MIKKMSCMTGDGIVLPYVWPLIGELYMKPSTYPITSGNELPLRFIKNPLCVDYKTLLKRQREHWLQIPLLYNIVIKRRKDEIWMSWVKKSRCGNDAEISIMGLKWEHFPRIFTLNINQTIPEQVCGHQVKTHWKQMACKLLSIHIYIMVPVHFILESWWHS